MPLLQSILSGSVMATELLILNSVTTATADSRGDTALHLAAKHGNTGQVCLLLKHRADHHKLNADGRTLHPHHLSNLTFETKLSKSVPLSVRLSFR